MYDLFTFHIKIKWKLVPIDEEIVYVPIQETLKVFKIEFIPDEGEKITLFDNDTTKTTRNLIYRAEDGTYRYLLSAGQDGRIKWRYTYRNETFLGEQEVHAETKGKRYIHHETINMGNLPGPNMQVSDFYCSVVGEEKDEEGNPTFIGYVFPWDAADRINEKSGTGEKCFAGRHCIGLVVWVGKHEHDVYDYSHLSNLLEKRCHGYVMSLTQATDKCVWAIANASGAKKLVGTYAYLSSASVVNDWNGYYNKKALGEFIDNTKDKIWDNFPAANACRTYGEKCGLEAPKNTTGWFLPSAGMINYVWKAHEPVETALKSYEITKLWDERFAKIKDYIEAGEDPVYNGIETPYIDDIKGFDDKETYWSSNEKIDTSSSAFLIAGTGTYFSSKNNQIYSQKPIAVRPFLVF